MYVPQPVVFTSVLLASGCFDGGADRSGADVQLAGFGEPCETSDDCDPDRTDGCLVERGTGQGFCSLECGHGSDCDGGDGMGCESLCSKGWWCVQEDSGCTERTCMDDCCERYNCNDGMLDLACELDCDQDPCIYCSPVQYDVL